MQTGVEKNNEQRLRVYLKKLGESQAVDRFLGGYAKLNTKRIYSYQLARYLDWLRKQKKVSMSPDELVLDNLRCVFETVATDVQTKRKHTSWMSEYVNTTLLDQGWPENARAGAR